MKSLQLRYNLREAWASVLYGEITVAEATTQKIILEPEGTGTAELVSLF